MTEKTKEVLARPEGQFDPFAHDNAHGQESTLRSVTEVRAQSKLDAMNFADKAALSPEQSDTLRTLETSILKGDLKSVETTLQQYKDHPQASKPFMDVLVKDLRAAGIDASFDVDPVLNFGPTGTFGLMTSDPTSMKDYFTKEHKAMCVYTNPAIDTWANRVVPTRDGLEPTEMSPDAAFKEISAKLASNLLDAHK